MTTFHPQTWIVLIVLVCTGLPARAARPLATLLPADTTLFVCTPDIQQLDSQWRATQFARLANDPTMQDFVTSLKRIFGIVPDSDKRGLDWEDLLSIGSGEVCWAAIPVENKPPAFLLLVQCGGQQTQIEEVVQRLSAIDAQEKSANVTADVVQRFQAETDGRTVDHFYFVTQGIFALTDNEQLARETIQRLGDDDDTPSLASSEAFQTIERQSQLAHEGSVHLRWFLDPFGYDRMSRPPTASGTNDLLERLKVQGFDVLQAVGGVVSFASGDHDLVHDYLVYAPGARHKAARVLNFTPLPRLDLPAWVPADIGRVGATGWNLSTALLGYGSWFDAIYAEGVDGTFELVLSDIREEPGGPMVDIRRELIEQLEGPIYFVDDSLAGEDRQRHHVAYAAKTRSPSRVAKAVRELLEGDPEVRSTPLGQHTAWVFQPTLVQDENMLTSLGPDLSEYAVCVADPYLFVANHVELLQKILESTESLADDAGFQAVQEKLSHRRSENLISWQFSRPRQEFRATYDQLRASHAESGSILAHLLGGLLGPAPTDEPNRQNASRSSIDFASLPAFDEVNGYLEPAYGCVEETPVGWLIRQYTLAADKSP